MPQAYAQNSLFSATPSTGLISPVPATRSDIFGPSNLPVPSPAPAQTPSQVPNASNTTASIPVVPAGQVALALSARFGKDALPIGGGLTWRASYRLSISGDYIFTHRQYASQGLQPRR